MSNASPARAAAFQILLVLERGQAHSDDLLRSAKVETLSSADRNLTTALVLGTLRWQIQLDHQIRPLLKHPNAKLDAEVLIALRLGAFQLLHLDRIPAHAAIGESVELTKEAGHRFASGMVNAVLRKLAAAPRLESATSTAAEMAMAYAHPAWMVERWVAHYGMEAARAICIHGQSQPAVALRIGGAEVERELVAAGIQLDEGSLLTAARAVLSGDVTTTPAFHEGRARLQDEGSQLVAEIAGRGEVILDCCAAPGGKTIILAERNPNATIVACESSAQRLEQLRSRLAMFGARIECRQADATALEDRDVYDLALADVPCSGTGTLGRNPEIRHRLSCEDLARQAERQRAILHAALRAVRPGGRVVYSTCSLEPEENEQVIAAVVAESRDARIISLASRLQEMRSEKVLDESASARLQSSLTPEGFLRLLPGSFQTDGFFVALIERKV
jgi:16S rRNA (cytosine967-C5)-methyltransferase